MRRLAMTIERGARAGWWWLRQVLGDAAYDNYLRSTARRLNAGKDTVRPPAARSALLNGCPTARLLTREEFYLDALRRRYSGVSRCC